MHKIKVFTDRYPFLGPIIWGLSVQYFVVQAIVALAWRRPSYSWRLNTISDLGNTVCKIDSGRSVCSPLHSLMNLSFVALGVIMATGSLLIYQEFRESRGTLIGFSLMGLAGLGTLLVGLFPENTVAALHTLGAGLPFLLGNLSLIILSLMLRKLGLTIRIYTFMSGFIPLIALIFYVSHHYGQLGIGGVERIVAYPQTIWLILFGLYMTKNRIVSVKRHS